MKVKDIEVYEGAPPPHKHTKGIKFSQLDNRERGVMVSLSTRLTSNRNHATLYYSTGDCVTIWVSAKTERVLTTKITWIKKIVQELSETTKPRERITTPEHKEPAPTNRTVRFCSQCGRNPVHYDLNVCYDCEYYN